jgi:transposase
LVCTKNRGLPIFFRTYEGNITDITTIKQLILDIKRIDFKIDDLILDRGMTSKTNLQAITGNEIKIIGGIPLTSNEAKKFAECDISEENELIRPSGLIYYEDLHDSLFGIKGRAVVCFNHTDLEHERSIRLRKIATAEKKISDILNSHACDENSNCLENEIKLAIKGVSDYFIVTSENGKVQVSPNKDNRKKAKLRDGKYLIFTTDFKKNASEIISLYFEKDVIEKIFNCFKSWLDLQPVRHFEEEHIDVYIFICYLAYLALALYKHHLGVNGWEGVKESLEELGRIRKTTFTISGEKIEKITVLTKEQKEIIKKLDFKDKLLSDA